MPINKIIIGYSNENSEKNKILNLVIENKNKLLENNLKVIIGV